METGVLAEELTCSVCLGLFQDPVALPCQHSFCAKCINDAWKTSKTPSGVSCPQCRQTFKPRPKLVKNHTLQNIVEKYNRHPPVAATSAQTVPVMCEYCIDTPTQAVKTCLKCETSFCSRHLQPHLTKQIYKNHNLIKPTADLARRQCPSHGNILEFYCEQDEVCVCVSCTIVENHKSHSLLSLEQGKDKLKGNLKREMQNLVTYQSDWTSEEQNLQEYEKEIEKHIEELKRTLSNEYSKWRKKLEEDEESALKKIDAEKDRVISQIKICSDSLREKIKEVQILDKEVKSQEHKDPLSFIQDVKQLLLRCSQLGNDVKASGGTTQYRSNNYVYVNPSQPSMRNYWYEEPAYNMGYNATRGLKNSHRNPNQSFNQRPRISQSQDITLNFDELTREIASLMNEYQNFQTIIVNAIYNVSGQLRSFLWT
ncbi:E3 ubiquitin/ISG15 ligase TRIM25-like [Hypanus sabinus]|uniref:E3 ubiquitin/ISG15 ligase TRIM25-like n=1 Tax=Hypanus sabinus TaxID=79690 RepID=UPI0028C3FC8A|nr:E3 ubiquitin/ISG15 ligase TRIM25-like [Hypanus sabinus]